MFLSLLSVVLTGLSAFFFARSLLTPDTGLMRYDPEVATREGRIVFSPSAPSPAPRAAGLLPGRDVILSVNGRGVDDTRDFVRAVQSVDSFSEFPVEVLRDGGDLRTLLVKPIFRPTRLDWIFELVFCLSLAISALVLCGRLPGEAFSVPLLLSVLLTLVFTCVTPFSYDSVFTNVLANAGNIAPWLMVIFAMLFPWRRGPRWMRVGTVGLVLVLYAGFCIARAVLYAHWMATGAEAFFADYRRLGRLVIFSDGLAYAVLGALLGSAYARSRLPRDRKMLQWMLAGVLIAFPPYFFLDQLPLILGGPAHNLGLGSLAQLFLSILPLFLLIALTRQAAFDLRSFLVRYGITAALLLVLCGLFGALFLPLKGYMAEVYRLAPPFPELFAAGTLVLVLASVRALIGRLLSRRARLAADPARRAADSDLELIIRHLARESEHAIRAVRLRDTRSILRGIVRTLQEPVRRLAAAAGESGNLEQQEAGAQALGFLRTLESLAGTHSALRGEAPAVVIARTAMDKIRPRFPGAELRFEGDASVGFSCYPEEVVQAVGFMLENAVESRDGRPTRVDVRARADASRVIIEIADDGPGMDPLTRRSLFKPFFTTKPGHQGLGLYFARMIVERNDGSVELVRGEEGGTTMRMAFPRRAAPALGREET